MAVVCGIATVIALPSIAYSHGEADATDRMGPQARVVYVPPAAAPDAYVCSASCAPKQAPDLSADEHRAMAAYWKSQTVTVPRSTTSSSSSGSVNSASSQPKAAKAQAQPKQAKAAPAPKQAAQPKAPRQAAASKASQPSTTVTVTQTQSTSTTAKGTTTTKNSTSTKTTTKG